MGYSLGGGVALRTAIQHPTRVRKLMVVSAPMLWMAGTRLAQLTAVSEAELLRLHGVGPKATRLLREALAAQGLAFAGRDSR